MNQKTLNLVLLLTLLASAGLGTAILWVDNVIWFYAQPHAIGLALFVLIDLVLAFVLFAKSGAAYSFAGVWGAAQFCIMIGNLFFGAAFGVDCEGMQFNQQDLRDYLLGAVQNAPLDYGFYRISPYTYLALAAIQPVMAVIGLIQYRRQRNEKNATSHHEHFDTKALP